MHPVKHYQVTFFKTVTADDGMDREIVQRVVDVFAENSEKALDRAKDEFCRLDNVHCWDQHADRCVLRQHADQPA